MEAARQRVEVVAHRGTVVCILIAAEPLPEATTFYTSKESAFQVGKVVYPAGSKIRRHSHPQTNRSVVGASEVLVVQSGRMIVDVYADDHAFLCSREMGPGDVIVLASGGHGFRLIEDTVLVEVKQGPYLGDQDKELF